MYYQKLVGRNNASKGLNSDLLIGLHLLVKRIFLLSKITKEAHAHHKLLNINIPKFIFMTKQSFSL